MRSGTPAALLGALVWSLAADVTVASLTTKTDGVEVEVRSEPERPVRDRKTVYTVRLVDAAGKPVTNARVTLTGRMADGMIAATPLRASSEPGIYRGEVLFTMEGRWDLTVRVVSQGRTSRVATPRGGGAVISASADLPSVWARADVR